jgi:hypothetical protein
MQRMILEVRDVIPFDMPEARICGGLCIGCPKKLLAFLEGELDGWQMRLEQGYRPSFGELGRLAACCRKIHAALQKNQLI